jgi:hypothetical protein
MDRGGQAPSGCGHNCLVARKERLGALQFDPVDLRMSSRQRELQGLAPLGKALDHVSMYGTVLSDEENAEKIHEGFSKFF